MTENINIFPGDLPETLEFNKILDKAQSYCFGEPGKFKLASFGFQANIELIRSELLYINELVTAQSNELRIPMSQYDAFEEELKLLLIKDYVLELESIVGLRNLLDLTVSLKRFLNKEADDFPLISSKTIDLEDFTELIRGMNKVLDVDGSVKKDATPELSRIRRMQQSKTVELQREFGRIVQEYKNQSLLTDNVESYRNGRRVLSVPAEHKRRIPGIIHDESTTGKTSFIEPQAIISINNDLFDLEMEERKEIYKILKEICNGLSGYTDEIRDWIGFVTQLDAWHAKFKLADLLNCQMPEIVETKQISFRRVRHPLLLLKHSQNQSQIIPFDLELFGNNRILLLSGPNAGGKSIAMKTVGLVQLMFQHGFLIPADSSTKMSVFHQIFGDIGDSQSIEEDLSTYSSHLKNMKNFTEHADENTLVLLDEFGSGTDPKLGGAIAEAVLEHFMKAQIFGVITTHYGNLKAYAFKKKGIVNGAMLFDKNNLSPTYELRVGRPGSSYAFEVAFQSGLDDKIIERAKEKSGKVEFSLEELLMQLEQDKIKLERLKDSVEMREKELDNLIRNYQQMQAEFEFKRKKLKMEQKEIQLQSAVKIGEGVDKVIREIQKEKDLEKVKKLAEQKKAEKEAVVEQIESLQKDVFQHLVSALGKKSLEVGDPVRIKEGGAIGEILEIKGGKVTVQLGLMKVVTKLESLLPAKEPIAIRTNRSVKYDIVASDGDTKSELDIRGYRREDALSSVEDFIDKALISKLSILKILHGKGNGTLKRAVLEKVREYKGLKSVRHPEPDAGGDGVTIIEI